MKGEPRAGTAVTVPWARFLALAVAAMLEWNLALSLVSSPTLGSVNSSQIVSGGVLRSMISLVVTHKRARLVPAMGGPILATAGFVLRYP